MVTEIDKKPVMGENLAKEKEELLSSPPQIDIDRIKFLLEVYRQTEGQPQVIRRARLFEKLCCEKPIFIDGNPIVGTLTKYKYGGYGIPEIGARWMKQATDRVNLSRGQAPITPEIREWFEKAAEYWSGKSVYDRTKEIILDSLGVDIGLLQKYGVATELTPSAFIAAVPDFSKVLDIGLNGIIAEIQEEKAKLDTGNPEDFSKFHFYSAALLCLNGMVNLAQRYASAAKESAQKEVDHKRREELERIAQTCEWIPANPARNFREALQCVWFIILGEYIETPNVLLSPPSRFTQYMYPYYKKGKEDGTLTDEKVIELLQFFFLKINGLSNVQSAHGAAWSSSRLGMHLVLGGLTPRGRDATNELDFLVVEAQKQIQLPEPLADLLYHNDLSDEFLIKCVDLIRTGIGQPSFHSVERGVARHLYHDKGSLEEARGFSIAGCVQSNIPGYSAQPWEAMFNAAKMIELALNNGKDPLSGVQIGPQTGEADLFQSYEEIFEAVAKQMAYWIPLCRKVMRSAWNVMRDFPLPFTSAFVSDCIKKGQDVVDGGARYNNLNGASMVAVIDLANSLAAIKKLVFEDKKITMGQLKQALSADYEGYEDIQRMCLDAPKYGNDDDYVDQIAQELYEICYREHQKYPDFLGRPAKPEAFSVTTHFAVGRFTGALPDGRKARTPLTDASVSATPGTDKNGPTALVKSATKVIDTTKFGGNHFNMKFHPAALEGSENARKFLSLVKTYMDLGGYHIQFNCVSSETLIDAQLHPENYRNLIVRVAGFSAFFIYLDPAVQGEIIRRTELRSV